MVFTAIAKIIFTLVILFTYQPYITIILAVCLLPSIIGTRWAISYVMKTAAAAQGAKGTMSTLSEETITNIKTVKCFAEEANHIEKF